MIFKKFLVIISLIFIFFVSKTSYSDEVFKRGKEIFLNEGNCASCHTLSDAESIGVIGPNLDEIKPSIELVLSIVKNGRGVMPGYQEILNSQEIEAVSQYVSKASNW